MLRFAHLQACLVPSGPTQQRLELNLSVKRKSKACRIASPFAQIHPQQWLKIAYAGRKVVSPVGKVVFNKQNSNFHVRFPRFSPPRSLVLPVTCRKGVSNTQNGKHGSLALRPVHPCVWQSGFLKRESGFPCIWAGSIVLKVLFNQPHSPSSTSFHVFPKQGSGFPCICICGEAVSTSGCVGRRFTRSNANNVPTT